MSEQFLYERLTNAFEFGVQKPKMPEIIVKNLNPKYKIRPYQADAFARFIYCLNNEFPGKSKPLHLLFNMATGSGKTLIMAGLILYLYEQGYRNFLFFVNADNIIEKTKDNFLNPDASKYLFNESMYFKGKQVAAVTMVDTFEGVNENDINIRFSTIQNLHNNLTTHTENALSFEDFKKKKIVLLSDEAHHMNVSTMTQMKLDLIGANSSQKEKPTWENTVENIFNANDDNLLLEFTATFDDKTDAVVQKYRNKIICRYDLVKFRNDKYSKDIEIVRSEFSLQYRILQAIILHHYKQSVATEHNIQLKPVILFKAKTIPESEKNKHDFHILIERLTADDIDIIRKSDIPIIKKAFRFFDILNLGSEKLARRLREDFQEKYCLAVNSKVDREKYQVDVNRLEEKHNPIRAIFAVQMLSEGWDVLNLFDIVRCYDTGSTGHNKIGRTTIAEAQLIGRGARYYPFHVPGLDYYKRKFDENIEHELRVLEELHYHSINDSPYISEIRKALITKGLIDEQIVTRKLQLKDSFKNTNLYKSGVIWLNKQVEKNYEHVKSFADLTTLSVKKKWHGHKIQEGSGFVTNIMDDREVYNAQNSNSLDIPITDIEQNIVQAAIARNPFFKFASLTRWFPHLKSMCEFRTSDNYMGGLAITFSGDLSQLENNLSDKLVACCDLLEKIEAEIRLQITDFKGTTIFHEQRINAVFTDKTLKFSADNPRIRYDSQEFEHFVRVKDWFAFNGLYGTSEERGFVKFLTRWIAESEETYDDIYLLRNARHFAIYNFSDGRAFEPDFVLFLGKANGESLTYQLFIEPKGEHLENNERWKENFLKEIFTNYEYNILSENRIYRVIGVPTFYNLKRENEFKTKFIETLKNARQMQKRTN